MIIIALERIHSTKFQLKRNMKNIVSRAVSFNPGAKYLILYNRPKEADSTSEHTREMAFRMFTMMYKIFNAANVVILYAINDRNYNVFITDPYQNSKDCGNSVILMNSICMVMAIFSSAFIR